MTEHSASASHTSQQTKIPRDKEAFTDMDNFGITFPMDLDVRCKATLIGACFLIDYMFFEKKANQSNDGLGMLS